MSYTAIASQTLTSSASSVTFSSIPGTFRDLVLVSQPIGNQQSALFIRFNGDSGNNYQFVRMSGNGSTASSANSSSQSSINIANLAAMTTTSESTSIVQIMDYSVTDKHKTVLCRFDTPSIATSAIVGRWANTSAINSIEVLGFDFVAGSTFSLYGIAA